MKRLIYLFTFLFTVSSSFLSCKDAEREVGETEILEDDMETDIYEEEEDDWFGTYDLNDDDMLDANEFGEANRTVFSDWDEDDDDFFNDEEYYISTFTITDVNNDDMIDENEWTEGVNTYYSDYATVEDWDTYDLNDDGFLDSNEWNEGFADTNWFSDFDMNDDDLVDYNEWSDGLFDDWDSDADGFLDEDEYAYYNRSWVAM